MGWNYKAFLCYNLPKKHKDCDMRYISGWEALNVPNEQGVTADWHSSAYFHNLQPNKIYDYNKNNPLKMLGIKKRFIAFLGKEYFVASFARAIADLVYLDNVEQLRYCVNDFLSKDDEKELFEYLKIINQTKNIEEFMKWELTELYFKDKKCLNPIK